MLKEEIIVSTITSKSEEMKAMSRKDRNRAIVDILMNNAMFIIIFVAVLAIAAVRPRFLSLPSIINIINLTAAKLPIALGVGVVRWVWLPVSLPVCS